MNETAKTQALTGDREETSAIPKRTFNLRPYTSLISVATGLLLWEAVARYINSPLFLATPTQTVEALYDLAASGELAHHMYVSGLEFIIGYSSASVLGIVYRPGHGEQRTRKANSPAVGLRLLFNADDRPRPSVHPVARHRHHVEDRRSDDPRGVPSDHQHRGRHPDDEHASDRDAEELRRQPLAIFFMVSLPSATPFILAGLKIAIGRGLIAVVVAELFGSRAGMGRLISASAESFDMPDLFAAVVVLAASGIALTSAFSALEKRLVPWTKE